MAGYRVNEPSKPTGMVYGAVEENVRGTGPTGFKNDMSIMDVRVGDQFYVGGQGEIPGVAEVQNYWESGVYKNDVILVIRVAKDHVFDYVENTDYSTRENEQVEKNYADTTDV